MMDVIALVLAAIGGFISPFAAAAWWTLGRPDANGNQYWEPNKANKILLWVIIALVLGLWFSAGVITTAN